MPVDQAKWHNLLSQTQDLVQLDHHGYPVVQRDLQGLLQSSQTARARTSRVRSAADQAAASRLLANQGFDASRLQQDVAMLELAPRVGDVFSGDGGSVDDYLAGIQEMSILAAIQEAQQDSILSFERHLDEAMARDWAADKGRLMGAIAPYTGLGGGGIGQLSFGTVAPRGGEALGGRVTAKEQAYIQVVKRLNAAAARHEAADAVAEFGAACAANEDRAGASTTQMSSVWALLGDILAPARARGLGPGEADFMNALVQGGRAHLSKLFARHIRATISKHRAVAQRGGDPDQLRDIQAYLSVKFKDRGPLDFQQAGGQDTSWVQVYYALRAGQDDLAIRAAARAGDPASGGRALGGAGGGGLASLLQAWLADPAAFRAQHGASMLRECERLAQLPASKQAPIRADYQLLVTALLAGDARALDAATRRSPGLAPTIEDFMWLKLSAIRACGAAGASGLGGATPGGGGGSSAPAYRVSDLQSELNRWPAKYYSREGAEPLLYVTVLLLSCQFRAALRFLATDDSAKALRADAVHLAVALHFAGLLANDGGGGGGGGGDGGGGGGGGAPLDVPGLLRGYGARFVRSDSEVALQYYMLAAAAGGGSMELKGRLFRELLVESKDYGTLLGAGGPLGAGGAIRSFVSGPEERCALLEAVAYDCQLSHQPDEARELFMAARRPRAALRIVNQQLSAALHETKGALDPAAAALIERGQAAVEAMGGAAADDVASRREAEAFQQLCLARRLLELAGKQQWDAALQVVAQLSFIPGERARVEACKSEVRRLDDAVRQRLGDVLEAAADALLGVRSAADATMLGLLRERAECLKQFVLDLDPSITPSTFMHIASCLRAI